MPKASYEASVIIEAPQKVVYEYVSDLQRHLEWNHQPQEMEMLTDAPAQVGSRYETKEALPSNLPMAQRVMMAVMMPIMRMRYGFSGNTIAEITSLVPNEKMTWTAHIPSKKGDLMRMHWELELQPQNGTTLVIQRCRIDPPDDSPFASMVNEEAVERSQAEAASNLNQLKSLIEASNF